MSSDVWEQLGTVSRVATSSAISAQILETVRDAELPAGSPLPSERTLAAQLGVSRTTVREAIHELTLKGILHRKQGSGTVLAQSSGIAYSLFGEMTRETRTAAEVSDFRSTFEPHIASLAAERRTDSDLIMLEKLCPKDISDYSLEQSLELDERFHESVASATQNQLIVTLAQASGSWVSEFRRASHATPEGRQQSHDDHRAILVAIAASDAELARRLMRTHIKTVALL